MGSFEVRGGRQLKGEIVPQGAKNEALQILSAVLLTAEPVTIANIPDILDVNLLIELLDEIGVKISRTNRHTCTFQADAIDADYLASDEFRKKRRPAPRKRNAGRAYVGQVRESLYTQTRGR